MVGRRLADGNDSWLMVCVMGHEDMETWALDN
jgi:hypothetical protein